MMTKEEVAGIVAYCTENNISQKQRLAELGIFRECYSVTSLKRLPAMFSLGEGMRYWLYSEPTDMRKSFHTLSGLVREVFVVEPVPVTPAPQLGPHNLLRGRIPGADAGHVVGALWGGHLPDFFSSACWR